MPPIDETITRQQSAEGVADHLGHWFRERTGACETALWIATSDGRFRLVGGTGLVRSAEELGFQALPAGGDAARAPFPWRDRHAFAALPLADSDDVVGVFALAFDPDESAPVPTAE